MQISQQNKILIGSFLAFLSLYYFISRKSPAPTVEKKESITADTFIPRGFVLVPISIDPSSQISGLIDQFALVDLYAPDQQLHTNSLIASNVKLIRAPLNPQQFAVLVTEDQSREVMKISSPFWVTLHNRSLPPPVSAVQVAGQPQLPPAKPAAVPIVRAPVKIEYYKGI